MDIPRYSELMERTDAPPGSNWRLFGANDELGTVNFATAELVRAACGLVRRGATFGLDFPLDAFEPPMSPTRKPPEHVIFGRHADQRDDYLDGFYLQASSHIDGLRHRRHSSFGFYNGVADDEVDVGTPQLGINRWAESGIVGRGVLVDVDRHLARAGRTLAHERGESFGPDLIDAAADAQELTLAPGDMLLLRTGWTGWFFAQRDAGAIPPGKQPPSSGVEQSRAMLEWMWDHRLALVAADNMAFEALPVSPSSPFHSETDGGLMHQEMIALLGLAIGELWNLDALAADCADDGIYEFMLVCKPLHLTGGVGSPANAIALK